MAKRRGGDRPQGRDFGDRPQNRGYGDRPKAAPLIVTTVAGMPVVVILSTAATTSAVASVVAEPESVIFRARLCRRSRRPTTGIRTYRPVMARTAQFPSSVRPKWEARQDDSSSAVRINKRIADMGMLASRSR